MSQILQLFTAYPWLSAACLWLFAAGIRTMPAPLTGERWYGWVYDLLHLIGANLSKVGERKA